MNEAIPTAEEEREEECFLGMPEELFTGGLQDFPKISLVQQSYK